MPTHIFKKEELSSISEELLNPLEGKTLCFYGEMGAGKTTLIKALLKQLGAVDTGNSPTFGLVNEYHDIKGALLAYHFDFYRIEDEEEVFDMGIEEYLDADAYIFIEWPERIPNLIPKDAIAIKMHFIDETTRSIEY